MKTVYEITVCVNADTVSYQILSCFCINRNLRLSRKYRKDRSFCVSNNFLLNELLGSVKTNSFEAVTVPSHSFSFYKRVTLDRRKHGGLDCDTTGDHWPALFPDTSKLFFIKVVSFTRLTLSRSVSRMKNISDSRGYIQIFGAWRRKMLIRNLHRKRRSPVFPASEIHLRRNSVGWTKRDWDLRVAKRPWIGDLIQRSRHLISRSNVSLKLRAKREKRTVCFS